MPLHEWNWIYKMHSKEEGLSPFGDNPSPRLKDLLSLITQQRAYVLDVGCGDGRNVIPLLKEGMIVFGIDISRAALMSLWRKAINKALERSLHLTLHDVNKGLPFRDNIFDGVIDSFTFTFISNRSYYLAEVQRVLREGGILMLEFNLQPHIITHSHMLKIVKKLFTGLRFRILKIYKFFHAWGCISDESIKEIPAVAIIATKI